MKIYNFGSINIDRVYTVEHFVRPGETLHSTDYNEFAGGKGLNQSIALARAGSVVHHVGKIGPDGQFLKELLLENNVDATLLQETDGPTGHAIIQVTSEGENSIILYGGANQQISREEIQKALVDAESGDWLLLQNEISNAEEVLTVGAERGIKIMYNPAPMTPQILDLPLASVQWMILNEVEGEMISGQQLPDKILETMLTKYPEMSVVLTLGSSGVHLANKEQNLFVPAEKVTPVDTTGAGDTFVGYFLAGLAGGTPVHDCLTLATRAAAICVTRPGAAASIPLRQEL